MTFIALFAFAGCEKVVLDEESTTDETKAADGNVIIRASLYNIVPFDTRAEENIADYCSTLQFVLYQNDTKVKAVTQKKGDSGYGVVGLTLEEGTYKLLVLAHSSKGNPSVADPTMIKFTNQDGYSDTFFYYGDLTVTEEKRSYEVMLQRATSMVRVTITDEIPANVTKIRLYYEGESGVLNAVTGMGGETDSKQSIWYNVVGYSVPLALRAYTFLRNEEGKLQMTVTAYDNANNIVAEKQLTNIPMKHCMVTDYEGRLFSEEDAGVDARISFLADTEWKVYRQLTF